MKDKLKVLASILLGNALLAFSICAFVVPNGFMLGGSTGIALAVQHFFSQLPLSVLSAVINGALFVLGWLYPGSYSRKCMKRFGLTNNQLKLIAMVSMTCDHVGLMLLPQVTVLRLIGRLAFPIYAYMIAEGCRHTRNLPKYLGSLAAIAALCQIVCFFAMDSLYQCVMVTFSLSVCLVMLLKNAMERKSAAAWGGVLTGVLLVFFITEVLPPLLSNTDFRVDYGFLGVMLPVGVYAAGTKLTRLSVTTVCLVLMAGSMWAGQWFSLLALPVLALYNGQRGRLSLKRLFYIYYPVHLAVIQALVYVL